MKILLTLLFILTIQINCRLLLDCEDRSWYCKNRNRAERCQKMDECFPPTTPDDSVKKVPCTFNEDPYIAIPELLANYRIIAKRHIYDDMAFTTEEYEDI